VTPEQIKRHDLPTRPPKTKKLKGKQLERAKAFGDSIEVDALPTPILQSTVRGAIESLIDPHELEITRMIEQQEREGMQRLFDQWTPPHGQEWMP
jgi:hypothetical protein